MLSAVQEIELILARKISSGIAGAGVGDGFVGAMVGLAVVGADVVGENVGTLVVGADVVGENVGTLVVGADVVGENVGTLVLGATVGSVVGGVVVSKQQLVLQLALTLENLQSPAVLNPVHSPADKMFGSKAVPVNGQTGCLCGENVGCSVVGTFVGVIVGGLVG